MCIRDSTDPVEVVKSLSTQKAAAVKEELEPQLPENWLVIGAEDVYKRQELFASYGEQIQDLYQCADAVKY